MQALGYQVAKAIGQDCVTSGCFKVENEKEGGESIGDGLKVIFFARKREKDLESLRMCFSPLFLQAAEFVVT